MLSKRCKPFSNQSMVLVILPGVYFMLAGAAVFCGLWSLHTIKSKNSISFFQTLLLVWRHLKASFFVEEEDTVSHTYSTHLACLLAEFFFSLKEESKKRCVVTHILRMSNTRALVCKNMLPPFNEKIIKTVHLILTTQINLSNYQGQLTKNQPQIPSICVNYY